LLLRVRAADGSRTLPDGPTGFPFGVDPPPCFGATSEPDARHARRGGRARDDHSDVQSTAPLRSTYHQPKKRIPAKTTISVKRKICRPGSWKYAAHG
jgi:hypothetical protein